MDKHNKMHLIKRKKLKNLQHNSKRHTFIWSYPCIGYNTNDTGISCNICECKSVNQTYIAMGKRKVSETHKYFLLN